MGHEGMKSSLVSRDVIADSVELTVRGHCYDALVGIAGCDKSLPGLMMVMVRLNIPSVFLYGGSILPGRFQNRDVTIVDVFEAVGQHSVGTIDDASLHELESVACPSAGSCGGQFTANTMACVSEAIGLALTGSSGAPAPYNSRDSFAESSGAQVMRLLAEGIRPRDIVTREALENAAVVVAATGGSTNAGLHLPAIAHEAGIAFDLHDVCEIFRRTPYIADLKPGGRYVAKDLYEAGGVQAVMKTLLDGGYLNGDCLTVSGRTIAENLEGVVLRDDQDVIRPAATPLSPTGGVVGLRGNLAPQGAIVKVAGMKRLKFSGPAQVFECEEDAFAAVQAREIAEGAVIVIRYEGPRGGPGMREMLSTTAAISGQGMGDNVALITDGRFSGGDARILRRPRRPRGRGRRPDRIVARRRYDLDRRRGGDHRGRALGRRTRRTGRGVVAQAGRVRLRHPVEVRSGRGRCREGGGDPPRRRRRAALLRRYLSAPWRRSINRFAGAWFRAPAPRPHAPAWVPGCECGPRSPSPSGTRRWP